MAIVRSGRPYLVMRFLTVDSENYLVENYLDQQKQTKKTADE
jgi:hypothetical protein